MMDIKRKPVPSRGSPWNPSPYRRLPWSGLGAMLGALVSFIVAIIILVESDGEPTSIWIVQPSVYLAIASAFTNVLLYFAFKQAVTVAWWRRAALPNATIADLHRYWSYGDSVWESIVSGKRVNIIAIASILVAIVPVNGPFIQRASRSRLNTITKASNVQVQIAQKLPSGYAGVISGRSYDPSLLTPDFRKVVNAANAQVPITINSQDCTGICTTAIQGASFQVNCTSSPSPCRLGSFDNAESLGVRNVSNDVTVFLTKFIWSSSGSEDSKKIRLNVQNKDGTGCVGNLQVQNCSMYPATVTYQVVIDGNRSTIELAPGTNMSSDRVEHLLQGDEYPESYAPSQGTILGGFYKALSDTYDSSAGMSFSPTLMGGYNYGSDGATANRYAVVGAGGGPDSRPHSGISRLSVPLSNRCVRCFRSTKCDSAG